MMPIYFIKHKYVEKKQVFEKHIRIIHVRSNAADPCYQSLRPINKNYIIYKFGVLVVCQPYNA